MVAKFFDVFEWNEIFGVFQLICWIAEESFFPKSDISMEKNLTCCSKVQVTVLGKKLWVEFNPITDQLFRDCGGLLFFRLLLVLSSNLLET